MGDEEALSQSMEELEVARARLEALSKEAELLQISFNEHMRAIATIRAVLQLPEGREVLVPIGAGAFLPARTTGANWALVSLGAGVSQEKKFDEAVAALEKQAAEIELEERKILQQMRGIEAHANDLNQRIQTMSQGAAPEKPEAAAGKPGKRKKGDEEE